MKVALFGGTFDPIHVGHVFIASAAQVHLALDKVVFLPCWESPHKPGVKMASGEHRLRMVELAVANLPWAEVSDWELQRVGPSYSWETAEHYRKTMGENAELFWLIGMDQWEAIERWSRIDHLSTLVTFIVFPRDGSHPKAKSDISAIFLPQEIDVSGTGIRTRRQRGLSVEEDLPPEVARYVRENHLYAERGL